jgi:hypothetical protein
MFIHDLTCKHCKAKLGTTKLARRPSEKELLTLGQIGTCSKAECRDAEKSIQTDARLALQAKQGGV